MGVTNLWSVLSPSSTPNVSVSELSGQTVAIDLSTWIVEFRKSEATQKFENLYLRNLFHRILYLLKNNIKPVFVCDGKAPEIKQHAMLQRQEQQFGNRGSGSLERAGYKSYTDKCTEMIHYFGLPCIQSTGEAEALCAKLNMEGIVDGVITNDSDVLLYGAKKVFRNFHKEKDHIENCLIDIYTIEDIEHDLGLNQRSLIAMGLLIGCDYDKRGVENIGPKKALQLMKHLSSITDDPLARISGWRTNENLAQYERLSQTTGRKQTHCKKCDHLGTVAVHQENGCDTCKMEKSCDPDCKKRCPCIYHEIKSHELELQLRSKALKVDTFPNQEIIDEFLHVEDIPEILWKSINPHKLEIFMNNHLKSLNGEQFYDKLIPVLAVLQLHESSWCLNNAFVIKPIRVIRHCKARNKQCVETEWTKLACDHVTKSEYYTLKLDQELFLKSYSNLVEEYDKKITMEKSEKKKSKAKKRKLDELDDKQQTLKEFFKVRKKAEDQNGK